MMRISEVEPRRPVAAYDFICEATEWNERNGGTDKDGHLQPSGFVRMFCFYAVLQFGMMARCVLKRWRLSTAADLAEAVMRLIESECLEGHPEDSVEKFSGDMDAAIRLFEASCFTEWRLQDVRR